MPKNSRKAKAQHVRNHKRAAKRQAASHDRHAGRKTLPVSERPGAGISLQSFFARMLGSNQDRRKTDGPKPIVQYTQKSRLHRKMPATN